MKPERGSLLVARKNNMGIFTRSVVLLVEHEPQGGCIGLALNVPTQFTVHDTRLPEPRLAGALRLRFVERRRQRSTTDGCVTVSVCGLCL